MQTPLTLALVLVLLSSSALGQQCSPSCAADEYCSPAAGTTCQLCLNCNGIDNSSVCATAACGTRCNSNAHCNNSNNAVGSWCKDTSNECQACDSGLGCIATGESTDNECPVDCCGWLRHDPRKAQERNDKDNLAGYFVASACSSKLSAASTLSDVQPALVTVVLSKEEDGDATIEKKAAAGQKYTQDGVTFAAASVKLGACRVLSRSSNKGTVAFECPDYKQQVADADCESIVLVALVDTVAFGTSNNASDKSSVTLLVSQFLDPTSVCGSFVLEGNTTAVVVGVVIAFLMSVFVFAFVFVLVRRRKERAAAAAARPDQGDFTELGAARNENDYESSETDEAPPLTSRPDLDRLPPAERKATLRRERHERRERFYAERRQVSENLRGRRPYSGRKLKDPLRSGQSTMIFEDEHNEEQEAVRIGSVSPELDCDDDEVNSGGDDGVSGQAEE